VGARRAHEKPFRSRSAILNREYARRGMRESRLLVRGRAVRGLGGRGIVKLAILVGRPIVQLAARAGIE